MDQDRLKHSISVARKMVDIANEMGLSEEDKKSLFLIGYNHDIGYEYSDNGVNHNKIGGLILKDNGFKYWEEVYYHGEIQDEYESLYLTILNKADMQVDKYGNCVSYDERLQDIKSRYGEESIVYKRCVDMVEFLNK